MTDDESTQLKAALLKCADENENKPTFTGNVVVSSICRAARERIEELEWQVADLSHDKKMFEEGYVYEDYDPSEGCYEDEHKGRWVKRGEMTTKEVIENEVLSEKRRKIFSNCRGENFWNSETRT